MPRHRSTFRVVNRAGRYLSDASRVPFTWTDREAMALAFRSRQVAEAFVERRFVGGRQCSGIRVVP